MRSWVVLLGVALLVGCGPEEEGGAADDALQNAGAVYVFERDAAGVWSEVAYVKAPNAGDGDNFGYDVGLSGDLLACGVLDDASAATGVDGDSSDDSAQRAGAGFVFDLSP
jgi:hypothetical protein